MAANTAVGDTNDWLPQRLFNVTLSFLHDSTLEFRIPQHTPPFYILNGNTRSYSLLTA